MQRTKDDIEIASLLKATDIVNSTIQILIKITDLSETICADLSGYAFCQAMRDAMHYRSNHLLPDRFAQLFSQGC